MKSWQWKKVDGHSRHRDQNEQTGNPPLLGETRPNSALQGHWGRSRTQKMRRRGITEDLVASAKELELDSLLKSHNNCPYIPNTIYLLLDSATALVCSLF